MTQRTQDKQELLKQNFELTLIIIFIGLAFGLVGLVVPTAAVMSVVVISVGVIVGFVSYRDAFIPMHAPQMSVPGQTAQPPLARTEPPKQGERPTLTPNQQPLHRSVSQPIRQPPQPPAPTKEALPSLPKIHRLPSSEDVTISSPAKQVKPVTQQVSTPTTIPPIQAGNVKQRRPRARKADEVTSSDEEKKP